MDVMCSGLRGTHRERYTTARGGWTNVGPEVVEDVGNLDGGLA